MNKQELTFWQKIPGTQATLAWLGYALLFFAMPWSLFMLTISMIYLLLVTVIRGPGDGTPHRWRLAWPWEGRSGSFLSKPDYWPLTLLFWMPLLNVFVTDNWAEWSNILRIHLAFLVLPWVFYCLPPLSERAWRMLICWINGMALLSAIGIAIYYFLHFEAVQTALGRGQSMPMPVSHIRYSLFVAMGILSAIWMLGRYPKAFARAQKMGWWVIILSLILFLFILSVRSGIAALLIGLLVLGLSYAWQRRSYLLGLGIALGLLLLPVAAYVALPSFQQRVHYALSDFEQLRKGPTRNFSDSDRWISWQYGWELFCKAPWTGVGLADLRDELNILHTRDYGEAEIVKLPHNQFLFYLAGAGIPGMLLFCLAFAWPFVHRRRYRDSYTVIFFLVLLSSFFVEYTLETSLGTAFFLGFWALAFKREDMDRPVGASQDIAA